MLALVVYAYAAHVYIIPSKMIDLSHFRLKKKNPCSRLISGVTRDDAATWTCLATNVAGTDQVDHYVNVEWSPQVDLAKMAQGIGSLRC